jgi:hypothetical protein
MSLMSHPGMGHRLGYGLGAAVRSTPPSPLTQIKPQAPPATAAGIQQAAQPQAQQHGAPLEPGVLQGASPQMHSPGALPPGQKFASGLGLFARMDNRPSKPAKVGPVAPLNSVGPPQPSSCASTRTGVWTLSSNG